MNVKKISILILLDIIYICNVYVANTINKMG